MLYKKAITPGLSIFLIVVLALVFCVMRAIGFLGPSSLRWLLPMSFCAMMILPWVLLTAQGRYQIDLKKPVDGSWYLKSVILGATAALGCFIFGVLLYGQTTNNWYISIGNNYRGIMDTTGMSFLTLNLIFTIPAIIFSPIGEEIFFRGVLQETLQQKLSKFSSTLIECSLFGLVHLVHHGVLMTVSGIVLMPTSGTLWVLQMILVSWMFAWLRFKSGSLLIPIIAHMIFNIVMNQTIFLFLW